METETTEIQTETTTVATNEATYVVPADDPVYFDDTGEVIVTTEQLQQIYTYQLQQIELLEKEIEIQQNLYSVTSYLLAAVIGFALIKLFTGFFNSVITF